MLDDLWRLFGIGIEKFLDKDPEKFRDRLMSSYLSMTLLSVNKSGIKTPPRTTISPLEVDDFTCWADSSDDRATGYPIE